MPELNSRYKQDLGQAGEEIVYQLYLKQGYSEVARNFSLYSQHRGGKTGEIDLIFEKEGKLYLVEVKTRTSASVAKYGSAPNQLGRHQLRAMYKTLQSFLKQHQQFKNYFIQYDLASVINGSVKVIPNATNFDGF